MKISTILSGVLLFASTCYAVPKAVPVPESDFDIQVFSEDIFSPETADMINELISTYGLNKRDQATIASILQTVNDSGIIFEILDSVASSPKQIQGLANYTSLLVGQLNISLLLGMLTSSSSSSSSSVNTSGILSAVSNSGLIQSILLGTLLDTSFQPVLAHITERVIRANEDVLLYAVTAYLQPASSNSKRATSSSSSTAGSLSSFVGNLAGSLLNSQIFASSLTDTLGALNDTGIALYIVKRFLSNDLYINMTGTLITDVLAASGAGSSDITSLISTLNITSLIDSSLSNPDYIVSLLQIFFPVICQAIHPDWVSTLVP